MQQQILNTNVIRSTDRQIVNEEDASEQIAPMNENILQLVAQIPNHPLQKFAQKLLDQRPKSASELHSKNATDNLTQPKTNSPTSSTSK